MKTAVDHFAASATVRVSVVAGWTSISVLAFLSRFERMGPGLTALMAAVICGVGVIGLTWAVWPAARRQAPRRGR